MLSKTAARVEWYLKEALPLFLVGTLVLFLLDRLNLLGAVIRAGEPLVTGLLGLPKEASAAFLIGFLRRDFAATRLFDMSRGGGLDVDPAGRRDGHDHALHPVHRERLHDRQGARLEDGRRDGRLHLPAGLRDRRGSSAC